MKKEILKLTGLTEAEFYKKFPTPDAFASAYPSYKKKLGGLTEAFPQIATADNFFSYGVPVPPTYYMSGGPVYPQIQTDAQFFSPVYSNTNNAYAVGGSYMEAYPQAKRYPQGPVGGSAFYMMQDGGAPMQEPSKDQTFYTQKMNSFFDKLRQASYKNMMAGMMNTEEDTTAGMPQLSVGRYGGMPSFQPGGGVPANMIYDTFDIENSIGSASGTSLSNLYGIPQNSQQDMFYGRIPNPKGQKIDYSTRYGFDVAKELKDYPGLMQQVVDSNFNSTQDPRYLLLVAAGAISPNFADRFDVDKSSVNLDKLWNANKDLVFQQYKDDPEAFTGAVGDYRKMFYQNTDKKGFDQQKFDNLKTSKQKSDYLSSLQVDDAFTKSWNPRVDRTTANALSRMINPQAAATQSTPAASPAAATPAAAAATTNQPAAAASGQPATTTTTNTTTNPNYQTVTTADGQTFIVGPNNQLYSPFTGNQATANTNQQQQRVNPYPYMNRDGYYVGTGLDNVANFLIPNNQRQSYRDIREMEGMGMGDLTPEERAAFLAGDANLSKLNIETRRAIQKGNRLKSLTAEFNMGPSKANNPAAVVLGPPPSSTSTSTTSTTNQNQSATPGSTTNSSTSTQPGNAANPNATTSTKPGAPTTTTTANSGPSIDPNTGEPEMPSAIAARIEKEQKEAERKNLENYEKIKEMQIRQGKKPDAYDPNTNYDYGSKAASAQGTVDYTPPSQNAASNPSANAMISTGPTTTTTRQVPSNTNSMDAETAESKAGMADPSRYVNQAYVDARKAAASKQSAAPASAYSWSDAGTTPTRPNQEGVYTMDYLGDEPANNPAPVEIGVPLKTQTGPVVETNPNTGQTFRLGGPYVLPMYQGAVGPGQVMTDDPFGGSLAQVDVPSSFPDYSWDSGQNDDLDFESMVEAGLYEKPMETTDFSDKFKLGYKFGRKKKEGVNPYAPAIVRGIADFMNKSRENRKMDQYNTMMAAADKNFAVFDQDRGDYRINMGDFRPDQMVPSAQQGGPMMYDVADLFFLTPYMLKNTRGRR